jgi:SAM-dependent methyltransferase
MGEQAKVVTGRILNKDFWSEENLHYSKPHFRLLKCANIINTLAKSKESDLLDVGCGPATLARLLAQNLHYYGIDLAIHEPAENLSEVDILKNKIGFGEKKFDFVVGMGIFEYVDGLQIQKFHEINEILKPRGKFIATYINIHHRHPLHAYHMYNNILPISAFLSDLQSVFHVKRYIPTSLNWHGTEPRRTAIMMFNLHLNVRIPVITPWMAVEYIFICSTK